MEVEEIFTTLREGILNNRIPQNYNTTDAWVALQRLGLIADDKLTNAALILFGKQPELKFPQCLLRLARFRGVTKEEFIDNKQVRGNLFKLMSEALAFARTYLPVASTFPKDSFYRKDTPLFPVLVLREAIANALIHRDYSYRGGSVGFAIYDDRLEIWNYGLFPPGVSVDNLKNINGSIPRNPNIANVLYYHKIFESWGRGVQMILTECKAAGHPEPIYSQEAGGTTLTLISSQPIGSTLVLSQQQTAHEDILTERQKEIVLLLKEHKNLSSTELHNLMQAPVAIRTLRHELNTLKEMGLIGVTGQTTTRKWHSTS